MMKIKDEYDYLIHLLRCAFSEAQPVELPETLSLGTVLNCARRCEVAQLAYPAVQRIPHLNDDANLKRWEEAYYHAVMRNAAQQSARKEILAALHAHEIYTLEVQGSVVKTYYPQPWLRMMSDFDVIVPLVHLEESGEILRGLGYATEDLCGVEMDASKGNIFVELHTEFFDEASDPRAALHDPFSYAVLGEDYTATVSDTVFYLFHLLHTIKHCRQMGAGLRRIVDLYYLENALRDKVDYAWIDAVLNEYGFYEEKQKLLAVKDHLFGGKEPVLDIEELEAEIRCSGNHGTAELAFQHRFAREKAEGKHFLKLRYVLSQMFVSKAHAYSRYPFCKKHRLPLAVCWFYRWGCILFRPDKNRQMKEMLRTIRSVRIE